MSKGHEKHHERHVGLAKFGKDLVRRSGSHCELCHKHGVKLVVHEVPPSPPEPELEHCIFICEGCDHQLRQPKRTQPDYWHFLATSMWSAIPAVKISSLLMLHRLCETESWAAELLDEVYLTPEEQAWLKAARR